MFPLPWGKGLVGVGGGEEDTLGIREQKHPCP